MVHGSWFMVNGQEKTGAGSPRPGLELQIFLGHEPSTLSHEPWGMSHKPWAMSHEPLTTNNRFVYWIIRLHGIGIVYSKVSQFQNFKVSEFHSFTVSKFQSFEVSNFQSSKVSNSPNSRIPIFRSSRETHFRFFQVLRLSYFHNDFGFLGFIKVSWCLKNQE